MTFGEGLGLWLGAGLTLVMFSFIYKDNPLFKFGEHLYIGLSVGYYINVQYWQSLYPEVIRKISVEHNYWVILPALLGLMVVLRMVPKLAWLSRMSFAFYVGGASGLAIPVVIHGALLPQLNQTLRPFATGAGAFATNFNQIVILLGVFTVLIFFFFSLEHKRTVGLVSRVGLYFLMVGFGAAFGSTVMARISLLIGRFQFLITDFWLNGVLGHK